MPDKPHLARLSFMADRLYHRTSVFKSSWLSLATGAVSVPSPPDALCPEQQFLFCFLRYSVTNICGDPSRIATPLLLGNPFRDHLDLRTMWCCCEHTFLAIFDLELQQHGARSSRDLSFTAKNCYEKDSASRMGSRRGQLDIFWYVLKNLIQLASAVISLIS
jgi:hypothetical protein